MDSQPEHKPWLSPLLSGWYFGFFSRFLNHVMWDFTTFIQDRSRAMDMSPRKVTVTSNGRTVLLSAGMCQIWFVQKVKDDHCDNSPNEQCSRCKREQHKSVQGIARLFCFRTHCAVADVKNTQTQFSMDCYPLYITYISFTFAKLCKSSHLAILHMYIINIQSYSIQYLIIFLFSFFFWY